MEEELEDRKKVEFHQILWHQKFENTAVIAAGAAWRVPLTDALKEKYGIFNHFRLFNLSDKTIEVRFEQSSAKAFLIPAGGFMNVDIRFYEVLIYNRDANFEIKANQIIAEVEKII